MLLDTATRSLVAQAAEGVTTNPWVISCAYEDTIQQKITPIQQETKFPDGSQYTFASAPKNNTARSIKEIIIFNADTVTHNITVSLLDGVTLYGMQKLSISAGKSVQYSQGYGWFAGP